MPNNNKWTVSGTYKRDEGRDGTANFKGSWQACVNYLGQLIREGCYDLKVDIVLDRPGEVSE